LILMLLSDTLSTALKLMIQQAGAYELVGKKISLMLYAWMLAIKDDLELSSNGTHGIYPLNSVVVSFVFK
jgi:hypothetical protein